MDQPEDMLWGRKSFLGMELVSKQEAGCRLSDYQAGKHSGGKESGAKRVATRTHSDGNSLLQVRNPRSWKFVSWQFRHGLSKVWMTASVRKGVARNGTS